MHAAPHHTAPGHAGATLPAPTPDECPHGFADPAWCDLCRQGIGR